MRNLLIKELTLVINPYYFLFTLFGALLLIPQWVFFVAPLYLVFIALPNMIQSAKAQKDLEFTMLLPIRKGDGVCARVLAFSILEVAQVAVIAIFAALNIALYHTPNFFTDPNVAYVGCVFVMYGVFNIVFFPMFYKTGYKLAVPLSVAITASILFGGIIEMLVVMVPSVTQVLDGISGQALVAQIPVLLCGIFVFALLTWISIRISIKRFRKVNL